MEKNMKFPARSSLFVLFVVIALFLSVFGIAFGPVGPQTQGGAEYFCFYAGWFFGTND
jgi:hypothetical protein